MQIRKMKSGDYDTVYDLWVNTPCVGLNDFDDSREGIIKYLCRNPDTCFVSEHQDTVTGVILSGHDGRRGYIYHMAVRVSARRQGIGRALVRCAMNALEQEGIQKVAFVVFTDNTGGNEFWEKCGFVVRDDLHYRNQYISKVLDTLKP